MKLWMFHLMLPFLTFMAIPSLDFRLHLVLDFN